MDPGHEIFERQRGRGAVVAARQLAVMGEETRLTLLLLLHAGGPQSVTELVQVCGKTMMTVSHHLQVLGAAGMVESARNGRENVYRITPELRCDSPYPEFLGGFTLEGLTLLVRTPDPDPEPEPAPAPPPAPKRVRKGRK